MSGPPTDVPASDLWLKLSSAERPFEVVDFPREGADGKPIGQIAIWVLKQSEVRAARAEANKSAKQILGESTKNVDWLTAFDRIEQTQAYRDALTCELLFRCCRRPENRLLPTFQRAADVRELTMDESSVLIDQYAAIQYKFGPIVAHMTADECEAWIKRLQEGGSEVLLSFLSPGSKNDLLMYLVSQLSSSRTASSSATAPPDEPTSSD